MKNKIVFQKVCNYIQDLLIKKNSQTISIWEVSFVIQLGF